MNECTFHPAPWSRCEHLEGSYIALRPAEVTGNFVIRWGFDDKPGAITWGFDAAELDAEWAGAQELLRGEFAA